MGTDLYALIWSDIEYALHCQEKTCDISKIFYFFSGNSQNQSAPWLEIRHISSSATRGNPGVKPRVLHQPLAS